jgi:hypothetical protein
MSSISIIIPPAARQYIFWPAVLDADPTGATVTFEVRLAGTPTAGSPYAMTLQGAIVPTSNIWAATYRTTKMFIGSSATLGSDVRLANGVYACRFLLAPPDGRVIPSDQFRMVVQ